MVNNKKCWLSLNLDFLLVALTSLDRIYVPCFLNILSLKGSALMFSHMKCGAVLYIIVLLSAVQFCTWTLQYSVAVSLAPSMPGLQSFDRLGSGH